MDQKTLFDNLRKLKLNLINKGSYKFSEVLTLRKKCPGLEFFWSVFSFVWTEYRDLFGKFPYLLLMRENADQKNSEYGHFLRSVIYSF